MARPLIFLIACLLVSVGSCGRTRHSVPAGSFTILVGDTSVTEFFGIAEAAAKDLGYVRHSLHDQRMMLLMAKNPERIMTLGPGPIDGLYEVGARVWRDSDVAMSCDDVLAVQRSLREAFPDGRFIAFDATCPGLNDSSISPTTPIAASAGLQSFSRQLSVGPNQSFKPTPSARLNSGVSPYETVSSTTIHTTCSSWVQRCDKAD